MVPNEILQRVFFIKYGAGTGTCFYVSIGSKSYLVTAKHIFPPTASFASQVDIELFKNDAWLKFRPKLLIHTNPDIDIAVLDMMEDDEAECLFDIGSKNFFLSQECYFLGFPFGLKMDDDEGKFNAGFPLPFVKKGIISSFMSDKASGVSQLFLDGHNNPGFSGGPVVIKNAGAGNKYSMRIIAVVSAYLNQNKVINTPWGDFVNSENSGIVVSYSVDHVFEIIKRAIP